MKYTSKIGFWSLSGAVQVFKSNPQGGEISGSRRSTDNYCLNYDSRVSAEAPGFCCIVLLNELEGVSTDDITLVNAAPSRTEIDTEGVRAICYFTPVDAAIPSAVLFKDFIVCVCNYS